MNDPYRDLPPFERELLKIWIVERHNPKIQFTTGDYRSGDEGPAHLRSLMPEDFRTVPLVRLRKAIHKLTGLVNIVDPNSEKRQKRVDDPIKRFAKASHKATKEKEFSPEYVAYMEGEIWKIRSRQHKADCDWRCQLCTRQLRGDLLHVHHIYYPDDFDGTERMQDLLCLCTEICHPIADRLRQWGAPGQVKCPHGNDPCECEACFAESDFQYDAARERSIFG